MLRKLEDVGTGILVGLVIVGLIFMAGIVDYYQSHYTRTATICGFDKGGIVIALDENNHKWEFYGEGYGLNDKVALKMCTRHTDNNPYDDEIISVKIVDTL